MDQLGHRLRALRQRVERGQDGGRVGRAGIQPEDGLGDEGERALGPDDELGEVVAGGGLHELAAGADGLAGAEHGVQAEDLVAGDAVLHGPHAARVGGHVAAQAGAGLAREHRVHEPVGFGRHIELLEGDAGLHDGDLVLRVYLDDRVHPFERHHHAVGSGMQAPAKPVPDPAGGQRGFRGVGPFDDTPGLFRSAGNTTARGVTASRPRASSWE